MTAYDDFRFTSAGDLADLGGLASRFKHNITAIKLLKRLEAECRPPGNLTPDEQLTLARYSAGAIPRSSVIRSRKFPAVQPNLAANSKGCLPKKGSARYAPAPLMRTTQGSM
jgi:hypothetical protein